MRKTIAIGIVLALVAVVFATVPANAAITTFDHPHSTYLAEASAKIDISGLTDGNYYGSITDGDMTVTFSSSMKKATVPGSWATWSSPPYSETGTPHVMSSSGENSMTLTLSIPTTVFGFELEPNKFDTYTFTVDFYAGATLVGSIVRDVAGSHGARLFGAKTLSNPFVKVDISVFASNNRAPSPWFDTTPRREHFMPVEAILEKCTSILVVPRGM